jgi:hypothetical protein
MMEFQAPLRSMNYLSQVIKRKKIDKRMSSTGLVKTMEAPSNSINALKTLKVLKGLLSSHKE